MQLSLGLDTNAMPAMSGDAEQFDADYVLSLLGAWYEAGWLRLLDLQFARFLHDEEPGVSGLLLLAAALTSHQLGRGHACLDLAATLNGPERVLNLPPDQAVSRGRSSAQANIEQGPEDAETPLPAELLGRIAQIDWEASFHPDIVSDGSRPTPLIYDNGRLYLSRYWRYEQRVAAGIAARLRAVDSSEGPSATQVAALLDTLFGPVDPAAPVDWQRIACALAARQRFSIITGGPGTGKTTTVVRLLALLQALHFQSRPDAEADPHAWRAWQPLRIRLAAPTGKAAARLNESIGAKIGELPLEHLGGEALARAIPEQVVTLHRLLGGRPHVRKRTYHADNPLPLDVLVIDEASMVSLSDMADVIAALRPESRLILIGDKDQLSSVEAGAVLGELCRRASDGHYLPATAEWLSKATGIKVPASIMDEEGLRLDQAVAMLRRSYRFGGNSGIGRLSLAVNNGDVEQVQAQLASPLPDIAYLRVQQSDDKAISRLLVEGSSGRDADGASPVAPREGYGHYLKLVAQVPPVLDLKAYDDWAVKVLRAHRAFQVLCVLRNGPWGVTGLNKSIAQLLHSKGLISASSGWYAGRPVMVTRNNQALRLSNGDIGVVLPYPIESADATALRVAFPDGEGTGVRWFAPNRLDEIDTVYALTVHKSQGSEFRHVALVLPDAPNPVLTRELVYTGITRASECFTLVNPGGQELLRQAVSQRVHRSGGLGDLLAAIG